MKRLLAITVVLAMVVMISIGAFGCAQAAETTAAAAETTAAAAETTAKETEVAEDTDILIGVAFPFIENSPYTYPHSENLKKFAAERGWDIIVTDAKNDVNVQSDQIENMVAQGIDLLMIHPADAAGIVPVVKKVYEETNGELPIMAANSMTDPKELEYLVAFAGPNLHQTAVDSAKYYYDYMIENGIEKLDYCQARGTAGFSTTNDRTYGWEDGIVELGAEDMFNMLDAQHCDWKTDVTQAQTENWITTFGDELDMITCQNDSMALGVIKALQDSGYDPGQVLVSGSDGQTEMVELIMDGWALFTVFLSPKADALNQIEVAEKILAGEEVPYWNWMPHDIIDAGNAEEYLPIVKEIWEM